jgi:hypothetical protein
VPISPRRALKSCSYKGCSIGLIINPPRVDYEG